MKNKEDISYSTPIKHISRVNSQETTRKKLLAMRVSYTKGHELNNRQWTKSIILEWTRTEITN